MRIDPIDPNIIDADVQQKIKNRDFWWNTFSGEVVKSSFPPDYANPDNRQRRMEQVSFHWGGQPAAGLIKLSNKSDIRLFIILMTGLVILLEKYTGSRDIIVGAPIYRQTREGDYVNRILAIRNSPAEEMTVKELLLKVSQTLLEANEHVNYPLETLPYELNLKAGGDEFPLFEVAILLQNIHEKSYIEHLPLNIVLSFSHREEGIDGEMAYNAAVYETSTAERLLNHYNRVMEEAFGDIRKKVKDISILSTEEKQRLIFQVNETGTGYPAELPIHALIRQQAEGQPDRIAAIEGSTHLAYRQLNEESNRLARRLKEEGAAADSIVAMLLERSLEMIISILAVLKTGAAYLPIDIQYPEDRILYILKDSASVLLLAKESTGVNLRYEGERVDPFDRHNYSRDGANLSAEEMQHHPESLAYLIYTSGTTGKPKGVMIRHRSLVNYVWWAAKRYVKNRALDFPLYSSISFDLTVTSLYTPLVTGNAVVVYREEEKEWLIEQIIREDRVGVVKLTPSHLYVIKYRNPGKTHTRCFIVGGEELRTAIAHEINRHFNGEVEIYNEYGPTETTVGCMLYRYDPDRDKRPAVSLGKPADNARVYLLDRNRDPVPVGVPGEIYIAGDGVAIGYVNNPELTREKFVKDPFIKGSATPTGEGTSDRGDRSCRMYRSGDLGVWLPEGNLEFLGRVDKQVKIRGYRVELGEIEQHLLRHEAIGQVAVVAREAGEINPSDEKGDRYLCAYFTVKPGVKETPGTGRLREYLGGLLPGYMIPAFFVTLENIPLTPNGKVDTRALPKPEIKLEQVYAPPIDSTQQELVEIWSRVLGIEEKVIGIDANFFELGGQSLKQVNMMAQVEKELNVTIPMAEIFNRPTIRGLSEYIEKEAARYHYISIKPSIQKDYYKLSPAQQRMYILHQLDKQSTAYNITIVVVLEGNLDLERLKYSFDSLIKRHESLRTSFPVIDHRPMQRIHSTVEFGIDYYAVGEENDIIPRQEQENAIIHRFIKPFDLEEVPLMRVGVIGRKDRSHILIVDIHHIISDGTSHLILTREFMALYEGETLPVLRLQYRDYSEWLQGPDTDTQEREKFNRQEQYWLDKFTGPIPVLKLPTDYDRLAVKSFAGNQVNFNIPPEQEQMLRKLAQEENCTLFMVLVSLFYVLLYRVSGQGDIAVGTPVAGRRHPDLQYIIGMFVNTLVLRTFPTGEKTFRDFLYEIKKDALESIENQDYPFDSLVEKVTNTAVGSRNPLFDVMFALHNMEVAADEIPVVEISSLKLKPYGYQNKNALFDMILHVYENEGKEPNLTFSLEYNTQLFKEIKIQRIVGYFKEIISAVTDDKYTRLKDISLLTEKEKTQLLVDFNRTWEEFPQDNYNTVHRGFESQVEKIPHHIAVVYEDQGMTYSELDKRANQLGWELKARGMKTNSIAALVVERSLKMIIGILGILKSGGSYFPIDPVYPSKRIISLLKDNDIGMVLSTVEVLEKQSYTGLLQLQVQRVKPQVTPMRPPGNFEEFPIPDRGLVDYKRYRQFIGHAMVKECLSLQATRGCPYKCAFCHRIWPQKHSVRSAENIFAEIHRYYRMGVRRFAFIDDIFNLNARNSSAFFQSVIDNKLEVQLFFPNGMRGDLLTRDYIDLMVKAGTVNLGLALETASPRLQKLINKNLDLEKFRENVEYICHHHPQLILDFFTIFGFPTETEAEALETLEFIMSIKWLHFPYVFVLKIHPHTPMGKLAFENGIPAEAIQNSMNFAYHDIPETLPFSKRFAREYKSRFINRYFLSRERLLHVLPVQMKVASEDELIQKYDNYLPIKVRSFQDILQYAGISREQLPPADQTPAKYRFRPGFVEKLQVRESQPARKPGTLRVLLLDLSELFSTGNQEILHGEITEPLGLMYLMTYLQEKFPGLIGGKVAKSRVDFDSYDQMKNLVEQFKPDLIGIRTLSYYKDFFHRSVSFIKEWGVEAPIIAGGPYATMDYMMMLQDPHVELAVLGEGEITLAHLVKHILEGGKKMPPDEVLAQIPGIAFVKAEDRQHLRRESRHIIYLNSIASGGNKQSTMRPPHINQPGDLLYLISTSGSTGKPKSVMLEHRNLLNLMHYQFAHTPINFSKGILQFASICFDVSAQEIFSSLLSGGTLYLTGNEKKHDIPALFDYIKKNCIEVVFFPPSFLKLIFSESAYSSAFPTCIKHIISAGESLVLNENLRDYLRRSQVFLHNHYGPSETHVVTTYTIAPGEDIPLVPPIGKPISNTMISILDEGMNIQPIGIAGELYIGGNNVGRGYLNKPELTAEKFDRDLWDYRDERKNKNYQKFFRGSRGAILQKSPPGRRRLYKTGDLARRLSDGNIEYLGRIDHQVKIRGFRIELGEIENRMLKYGPIKEVVVTAAVRKKNQEQEAAENISSQGEDKYLCAYFTSQEEIEVSELKEYLSAEMPQYMVPAYFIRLEKIPLTSTGKVDRGKLPAPRFRGTGVEYATPSNEIEKQLTTIWQKVLEVGNNSNDVPGIDDNFFEVGGHSLKATILVSRLHETFNVKVTLVDIFQYPTIRELSAYLQKAARNNFSVLENTEAKSFYPLSPAQNRLYIMEQKDESNSGYNNLTVVMEIQGKLDSEKLKRGGSHLAWRHEALRTSFFLLGNTPMQKIHQPGEIELDIQYRESKGLTDKKEVDSIIRGLIRPFDLSRPPLLQVGLIKMGPEKHLLIMNMHHIITDGTSMRILEEDFKALYTGQDLPKLQYQYKDYLEWLNNKQIIQEIEKQENFWMKELTGQLTLLNLPLDYPSPGVELFKGKTLRISIGRERTNALKKLAMQEELTLYMLFLAIFNIFLSRICSQEEIIVGSVVEGRRHPGLERIVGFFVNLLVLKNYPHGQKRFLHFLREVKQRTLAAFENQDYPFDRLVNLLGGGSQSRVNPLYNVGFSFQEMGFLSNPGNTQPENLHPVNAADLNMKPYDYYNSISRLAMTWTGMNAGEEIMFNIEYSTVLFEDRTIELMKERFLALVDSVLNNPGSCLQDLDSRTSWEKELSSKRTVEFNF